VHVVACGNSGRGIKHVEYVPQLMAGYVDTTVACVFAARLPLKDFRSSWRVLVRLCLQWLLSILRLPSALTPTIHRCMYRDMNPAVRPSFKELVDLLQDLRRFKPIGHTNPNRTRQQTAFELLLLPHSPVLHMVLGGTSRSTRSISQESLASSSGMASEVR